MYEKLISDTLVKAICSCLESKIDIPNEYINAFITRTMLVVQKEDRKQISTLYPRLCDSVFTYFRGQQYNEKVLQVSNANDSHVAYEKPNNRAFVFKMGQLHACITILNDVIRKLDESETTINNKAYFVKNIMFFKAIANKPGIKHNELAEIMGKSPSSLSQFVLRIQQYNYFTQTVVGREKYYSLTSKGTKLFDELEIEETKESKDRTVASKPDDVSVQASVLERFESLKKYYSSDEFEDLEKQKSLGQTMINTLVNYYNHFSKHSSDIEKRNQSILDAYKEQETYKPDASVYQMYQ